MNGKFLKVLTSTRVFRSRRNSVVLDVIGVIRNTEIASRCFCSLAQQLSKDIAMLNDDNSIDVLLDWDTDALAMSEEELVKKVYQIFDSCGSRF